MTSPASSLIVLLSLCIFCTDAHAKVTVIENQFSARAFSSIRDSITTNDTGTTIPTVPDPLQVDAVIGEASSKNVIDWSVYGGQTVFSLDSALNRTGVLASSAQAVQFSLEFTVDVDSPYEMSGFLKVTDVSPTQSGLVILAAALYDSSSGEIPFLGHQQSVATHDEELTIGGLSGDDENSLHPGSSVTGMLLADHTYALTHHFTIAAISSDAGAGALGNITLKIGTVPEPSTFALCSILAALGLIRRRQIV